MSLVEINEDFTFKIILEEVFRSGPWIKTEEILLKPNTNGFLLMNFN